MKISVAAVSASVFAFFAALASAPAIATDDIGWSISISSPHAVYAPPPAVYPVPHVVHVPVQPVYVRPVPAIPYGHVVHHGIHRYSHHMKHDRHFHHRRWNNHRHH